MATDNNEKLNLLEDTAKADQPPIDAGKLKESLDSFASQSSKPTPVVDGTIEADKVETSAPITIPERPEEVVAQSVISSTSIPPEEPPKEEVDQTIATDAERLRQEIASKQGIFEELGLGEIKGTFEDLLQKGAFTAEAEKKAGIDEKTIALNEINSKLRETDLKFRRDRERIEDEPGLTSAQKNAKLNDVNRKQARELADLSVISATRRDDLATAQALVDRKVELHFEPIKQKLEFQQFLFNENKDLFNKAEQRQFESKLRKEEVQMEKDMFKFKQLEQSKAQILAMANKMGRSNDYMQRIMSAETSEELMAIPGIFDEPSEPMSASERKTWLDLAKEGDPVAIKMLGYNPSSVENMSFEEYDTEAGKIQSGKNTIDRLNENVNGLRLSTGAFQSPVMAGLAQTTGGGAVVGAGVGSVVPGFGTAIGAGVGAVAGLAGSPLQIAANIRAKDDFLSDLTFLVNTEGFIEFTDLKRLGLTFGALTEGERNAIFSAANELNSSIIPDENGRVVEVRGSTSRVKENIQIISDALDTRQDYLDARAKMQDDDYQDIRDL